MRLSRSLIAAAPLALACCVSPKQAPPPRPAPASAPRPVPSPTPAPVYNSWMDVPQTAGDWRYGPATAGSAATFGAGAGDAPFAIRCVRGRGEIELVRSGNFAGDAAMIVRTEALTRSVAGVPMMDNGGLRAILSPRDPLLDAMAFSKGRFAIEAPGAATLYLPSWPEVTRVIEDCR